MLEKVARAIEASLRNDREQHGAVYVGPEDELGATVLVDGDVDFLVLARAAIAAMREPTEEMVRAGIRALNVAGYGMPEYGPEDEAEMAFNAMIDAALTSSGPQAPASE